MFTQAQKLIISQVCSIQYDSLIDILTKTGLGCDMDGESYEDIMQELGFTRAEFDKELIKVIHNFKRVENDPEKLHELDEMDMLVFKHILNNYQCEWETNYPKALANLWGKIFIWAMAPNLSLNN